MMYSSPFDEAVSRPLLDEPVKKRWSLLSTLTTSSSSTAESSSSSTSHNNNNNNVNYHPYEAPITNDIQIISFDNTAATAEEESEAETEEQEGAFVLGTTIAAMMEEGMSMDVNASILQEQHADISEINDSMKQINEIQKVLANAVQAQEEDIQQLHSMSVESLDHASSGVSQLLAMQKQAAESSKRRKAFLAVAATCLLVVMAAHWFFVSTSAAHDDDTNGIPKQTTP